MKNYNLAHLTSEQKAKLDQVEKELDVVLIAWDNERASDNKQESMNFDI